MLQNFPALIHVFATAVIVSAIAVTLPGTASASSSKSGCADLSGRYSVIGSGSSMHDALVAMQATQAGYLDSGIELSGAAGGALSVWTKSGSSGVWTTRPIIVLHAGTDFECAEGRLVFSKPVANTSRRTESGDWFEGESIASLSRHADGGLSISVRFSGSETISLYSYDSANVRVPKPWTRTTITNVYRWPIYSDKDSLFTTLPSVPKAESDARLRLSPSVLGNVVIADLKPNADGVLAMLTMPRSADVISFEDRLRAAAILYETRVEPSWWNNAYHMELLIRPVGTATSSVMGPSAFRIEQELERTLPMPTGIVKVVAVDNGYEVTLNVSDSTPIGDVIRRVQLNSRLIGTMDLVEDSTVAGSRQRVVRLKVRVQ